MTRLILVGLLLPACAPPPLELVESVPPGNPIQEPGTDPVTGVPTERPLRLLFLGNSFTAQGPIAALVREVASSVGWPAPEVAAVAPGGQSLAFHRENPTSLDRVDDGGWDAVVLQDHSLRPTDDGGDVSDPDGFKADATWFYDRIKQSSPDASVVLYETWARHPDHGVYPSTFDNPVEMQAQLRFHYQDAAERYIPENAAFEPSDDVAMAPVGDAWEIHLAEPQPLVLHAGDFHHAGPTGQALNALVLYSTIYGVVATGSGSLSLPDAQATRLQASADAATGITLQPPAFEPAGFEVGRTVEVDFGTLATPGFGSVTNCLTGGTSALVDSMGEPTSVAVRIASPFTGSNESGLAANELGWPASVSQDVCWVGSFDGHDAALLDSATVVLDNLPPGIYSLTAFASREGDDAGRGRLTRYTVGGLSQDLEISDNTGGIVVFDDLSASTGSIALDIAVSPAGSSRFGYLGALTLTRTSASP